MKIRIFQINLSRDTNRVAFLDIITNSGKSVVDPSIYDLVYDGDIETTKSSTTEILEDVFITFNVAKPTGYHARSLSVSDVVEIYEHKGSINRFYFCRNLGWEQISFDASKTQTI